jgi:hypothetical protein
LEGNLGFLGQSAESGELQPALTWKFYDSPEESEKAVFQYFCHAPQVQMFEPFVENEEFPLPIFEFGETPKVFVISSVRLPHDALREIGNNLRKAG